MKVTARNRPSFIPKAITGIRARLNGRVVPQRRLRLGCSETVSGVSHVRFLRLSGRGFGIIPERYSSGAASKRSCSTRAKVSRHGRHGRSILPFSVDEVFCHITESTSSAGGVQRSHRWPAFLALPAMVWPLPCPWPITEAPQPKRIIRKMIPGLKHEVRPIRSSNLSPLAIKSSN